MKRNVFVLRTAFAIVGALSLVFATGCPDKDKDSDIIKTPEVQKGPEYSLQMVFDEAAKGPTDAKLDVLKTAYEKTVTDAAKADELADKEDGKGDFFLCKMLKLPAKAETMFVLTDFLGKVSKSADVLNKDCEGKKKPLDLMIASRNVQGDVADDADEIIKVMIDRGDKDTIAVASDKPRVERVLGAVNKKGDQNHLAKVMKNAAAGLKNDVIGWAKTNRAETNVMPALRGSALISAVEVVDEAAKGPAGGTPTDIPHLRFLYDANVNSDADAGTLATTPASTPTNDRFHNYLAALGDSADTTAIWTDYLTRIKAAGHPADATVGFAGAVVPGAAAVNGLLANQGAGAGAADAPFRKQLAKGASPDRNDAIKVMIEQGEQATVRLATAATVPLATPIVKEMFDAILAKGNAALLSGTFSKINTADANAFGAAFAWAKTNKAAALANGGAPNDVLNALRTVQAATPFVTAVSVVDEAAKGGGADKPTLRFLYEIFVTANDKAGILATTQASVATNDRFHNYLAALADDADTTAIWTDYLTRIRAAGHPADAPLGIGGVVAPGAGAVTGILAAQGAGGAPANAPFMVILAKGPGINADRQETVKVMIEQGEQGTVRLATAGNIVGATPVVKEMFVSVLAKGTPAFLQDTLSKVDPADANATAATLAWAGANLTAQAGVGGAANDVLNSINAVPALLAAITPVMVVDEAAKGVGVDKPTLRFLYGKYVTTNINAGILATTQASVATNDRFHNYLAALADDADTTAIWTDYLTRIKAAGHPADVPLGIGGVVAPGAGAVTGILAAQGAGGAPANAPFMVILAKGPGINADRQETVKVMIEQGEQGTVRLATAGNIVGATPVVKEMFVSVLAKGTPAFLQDTLSKVNPADANATAATLAWATANLTAQAGVGGAANDVLNSINAVPALLATITPLMVVDEAAKGGGAAKPVLKFLYDSYVNAPNRAGILATTPGSAGTNDRFHNYLAALDDDAVTVAIWGDYLTKIKAAGHPADVAAGFGGIVAPGAAAVSGLLAAQGAGGAVGTAPFRVILAKGANGARKDTIKIMVEQGEQATVRLATAAAAGPGIGTMTKLLDAIREKGNAALLQSTFGDVDDTDPHAFNGMMHWAMRHREDDIAASGTPNEILIEMRNSGQIDNAKLLVEVNAGGRSFRKVLFMVQVLAHDVGTAQAVAAINNGGVLLHNLIVTKAQTAESVMALKHYLSYLPFGGAANPGTWEHTRDDATATGGAKAADILKHAAHDGGQAVFGAGDDNAAALAVFESAAGVDRAQPLAADAIANQAP